MRRQHVQRCQRWQLHGVPGQQRPAIHGAGHVPLQCRLYEQRPNGISAVVQPYVLIFLLHNKPIPWDFSGRMPETHTNAAHTRQRTAAAVADAFTSIACAAGQTSLAGGACTSMQPILHGLHKN